MARGRVLASHPSTRMLEFGPLAHILVHFGLSTLTKYCFNNQLRLGALTTSRGGRYDSSLVVGSDFGVDTTRVHLPPSTVLHAARSRFRST